MKKISTHIWFDKEGLEAVDFYKTVFEDTEVYYKTEIHNTPSGSVDLISLRILDHDFTFLSAGPLFKVNPSISFMVMLDSIEKLESLWEKLFSGGKALMELGEYPFSKKYGWLEDKYGVSWQIMFTEPSEIKQQITPNLMFVGGQVGKAEEAINYYTTIFPDSKIGFISRYADSSGPDKVGTINHGEFMLSGQWFTAMDSALDHKFSFNEAISFIVNCSTQEEVDHYWEKLSAVPESEACGWCKDKYGVSWQVTPTILEKMMLDPDTTRVDKLNQAVLKMKKLNISELEEAFKES